MNKQIEELAEELLFYTIIPNDELCDKVAEYIINAGYRRQEYLIANMEEEVDGWKRHYGSLYETDKATIRTEVAREIFAQLEEKIEPILKKNYRLYTKYLNEQDSQTVLRIGGKIDALRGIYCFIENLKKKYGVTDDGKTD